MVCDCFTTGCTDLVDNLLCGTGVRATTVNGTAVTPAADGSFSTSVVLTASPSTITVVAKDAAGNETAAATDTIDLDRTAPVFASATLNGGATFTRSNSVTLTLRATGASGVRIATDGNAAD
jgi:hypothetical protein